MPPGLGQPQLGGMPGMQRPGMPGMQQRPGGGGGGGLQIQQHIRLGGPGGGGGVGGGMQMNRPQNSALMPNPNGQGLLRPPHRMQGPIDPRGSQPRPMEWDSRQGGGGGHPQGFQSQNQMNQRGPPGKY